MRVQDVTGLDGRTVVTIDPNDTIADVVYLLREHSIGAVVVSSDKKRILGIISERDVVRHLAQEQEGTLRVPVEELMTQNVRTCQLDDDLEATMAVMTAGHFRHMPIVTEGGDLLGIISLGDLVNARLVHLDAELKQARGE
ncbi:MAG: CBS domain-containing protein [Actinomycetia bacterium]|nr:CBS domain-containing protein [Actinomycetes bacterium]MCP4085503.1 CBS domain-containing protein [Actinomycetes bacterium]